MDEVHIVLWALHHVLDLSHLSWCLMTNCLKYCKIHAFQQHKGFAAIAPLIFLPIYGLSAFPLSPWSVSVLSKTACKYITCHWIIDCTMLVYVDVVARDKQCKQPQCQYWHQHLCVSCCSEDLYLTYGGFPTCSECSSSWSIAFGCKKSLKAKKSAKK